MDFSPTYLLMARLEEEIQTQRKLLNILLASYRHISNEARLKTLEQLKRVMNTLRLMAMTIESADRTADTYTREHALLMSAECLSLTALILEVFERSFPIFLENITLYEEPIIERMEGTVSFIESCVGRSDPSPIEDIIQSIEDITKALEYHITIGERSLKDIV
jgi:hypothetical protein